MARRFRRFRNGKKLNKREVKQVKNLISRVQEKKHRLEYSTGSSAHSTGQIIDLLDLSQGDTNYTRDGDELMLKSLKFRFHLLRESGSTLGDSVRMILFQWKPDNAQDVPTIGQILEDSTNVPYLSPIDTHHKDKFNVLMDRLTLLSPLGTTNERKSFWKTVNMKRVIKRVRYNPGASTGKNLVYLMLIGTQSSAGAEETFVRYYGDISFSDS